jgi:5-methylcytosine-specific restriction enzyme subunit McrC
VTTEPLVLIEHRPTGPVELTVPQRDALRALVPRLSISPAPASVDRYILTNDSTVGAAGVGDLLVELQPKVGLAPVLFLVSYALDPRGWRDAPAPLATGSLTEAVVALFGRTLADALRPGLLHGYRSQDEALTTVRGSIRFGDQMRRHAGLPLPVEVRYDDFTPDVLENRLLRTAVDVIGRMRLRHSASHLTAARLHQQLAGITPLPLDRTPPEPLWTRLNERYRPAVALARLIIASGGLEARLGRQNASAFLLDMNQVFESFVRVALREALRLTPTSFPAPDRSRRTWLDEQRRIELLPDLSWWAGSTCLFVGDCKYKRPAGSIPNADVYQMLAYLTAYRLDAGLLLYARGDGLPADVTVAAAGKHVHVRDIDVAQAPSAVLAQVAEAARLIQRIVAHGRANVAASAS